MSESRIIFTATTAFDREISGYGSDFVEALDHALQEHEANPAYDGNGPKVLEFFDGDLLLYRFEHRGEWGRKESMKVVQETFGLVALARCEEIRDMVQEIHRALIPPLGGLH